MELVVKETLQKSLFNCLKGISEVYDLQDRIVLTDTTVEMAPKDKIEFFEVSSGKVLLTRKGRISKSSIFKDHLHFEMLFEMWQTYVRLNYGKSFDKKGDDGVNAIMQNQLKKAFRNNNLSKFGFNKNTTSHEKIIDIVCKVIHCVNIPQGTLGESLKQEFNIVVI